MPPPPPPSPAPHTLKKAPSPAPPKGPPPAPVAGVKEVEGLPPGFPVSSHMEAQLEFSLPERINYVPSLLWELRKLNNGALPRLISAVGVDGTVSEGSSSPFMSSTVAAVGDVMGVIGGKTSPVCHNPRDKVASSPQDRVNAFSTTSALAGDVMGGDNADVSNSPSVIQGNLLRLLEKLSRNRDGAVRGAGPSADEEKGDAFGLHVDVDYALDDLFTHVFSVLESVVHKFLSRSLTREWKSRNYGGESVKSSVAKEYDHLWLLAWRQAECQDEEAWIAWKSALCRFWRRTRRECVSRERSEALSITLSQLDPLRVASSRFTWRTFPHDVEKLQDERGKTRAKLHALLCRVLYTCPVILIDQHTQRLAVAAEIDLDLLRRWILEAKGNGETEENIIGFIHALDRRKPDEIDDSVHTSLDEVERLFSAERQVLLCRFDAGQLPPSSPVVAPVSSCSPSLSLKTPASPALYSTTAFRRHVDPTPVELRPEILTEVSLATRFVSSPDNVIYPISTSKVEHETPREGQPAGAGSRSMVRRQEDLKNSSTSCSPHVRILGAERPVRQLPSTLKSPRSLSSW
ncbi:hypothetical protein LSM04_008115 [Trypanosoma melophagium]|uniref:uncharacterized protein n=1 Tax=Trypanosoma melophagium TaxID=715481 RepID=UPI003519EC71|nr:hypothetical protein LSM04_008115 [Trypanosoma melophagium]